VIRQAALGLQHAHEKEIAHGRVSPAAILIGQPNRNGRNGTEDRPPVKVSGFGLGRFAAEADSRATDFEYRAPEQFDRPELASPAADVYSLGCVFFHSLAGQPPFPAATPRDAANGHRLQSAPPLTHFRPELPPGVVALVATMLAKDPAARPTADQVATRLAVFGNAAAGEAIALNLPPVSYSAATSILHSPSGSHPPVAAPVPSPFEELTSRTDPHERTPIAMPKGKAATTKRRKAVAKARPRGRNRLVAVAAFGVLLAIAVGVGFALTVMLKRATAGP
jgi:serine/threonine-protein kinase